MPFKFWKAVPRLIAQSLRKPGWHQHFIPVRIVPSSSSGQNPYAAGRAGAPVHTELENRLDAVQALLLADLKSMVRAHAALVRQKKVRRQKPVPTLDDVLKRAVLGPSSSKTLLPRGSALAQQRENAWDSEFRGYLPPVKANQLRANSDEVGLKGMVAAQLQAISLVGRALIAARASASGVRHVFNQAEKGRRPEDETISRHVLDHRPLPTIMEMTEFSFVSAISASEVWQDHHGESYAIDFHRVFDLAVFAGRLARGETAFITWDCVRYYLAHHFAPNVKHPIRSVAFSNTTLVHDAIEWILAHIDDAYNRHALTGEMIGSECPGEGKAFRRAPLAA